MKTGIATSMFCLPVCMPLAAQPSLSSEPIMPAFPLKLSSNGRYLVDQKSAPFLIAGATDLMPIRGDNPRVEIQLLSHAKTDAIGELDLGLVHSCEWTIGPNSNSGMRDGSPTEDSGHKLRTSRQGA